MIFLHNKHNSGTFSPSTLEDYKTYANEKHGSHILHFNLFISLYPLKPTVKHKIHSLGKYQMSNLGGITANHKL